MRHLFATIALLSLLAACGSQQDPAPTETTETETTETGSTETGSTETGSATGCGAHTDCTSCLGADGCNWTGGECATGCMMDTYCIGPANPSAPTCSTDVQILGRWQHDASASQGSDLTFVPADRELGPARFRRTLAFYDATEDGPPTVTTNVLAPNDAHYEVQGTWSVSGQTLTLTYRLRDASEDTVEVFEVVEANGSTVRLRPTP